MRRNGFHGSTLVRQGSTPPIPSIAPATTTEQKYDDEYDQN